MRKTRPLRGAEPLPVPYISSRRASVSPASISPAQILPLQQRTPYSVQCRCSDPRGRCVYPLLNFAFTENFIKLPFGELAASYQSITQCRRRNSSPLTRSPTSGSDFPWCLAGPTKCPSLYLRQVEHRELDNGAQGANDLAIVGKFEWRPSHGGDIVIAVR